MDPENKETFPGANVAPVSVTWAERMVTFDGGVSVIAKTTEEFPLAGPCAPYCALVPQPASAAQ